MSERKLYAELNELLVNLGRCLLQYTCEAWPWTDEQTAAVHAEIETLAERQSQLVADIADWLDKQEWPVDYGVYPAEYTDLHYVSLSFLMAEIVRNADELTAEVEAMQKQFSDTGARPLIDHVLAEQKAVTAKLQELAKGVPAGQPA